MIDAVMGGGPGGDLIVSDVVSSGFVPISSRKPNCNSFGTFSPSFSFPLSIDPSPSARSCSSFKISSLVRPPHPAQRHARLSAANRFRSASPISIPPTWPFAPPSMNARKAHSAVRMPHAGCHVSSWCPLMLRQISRLTSKRPDGVRKRNEGGRNG